MYTLRCHLPAFRDHDAALAMQLSREWASEPTLMPPPPTIPVGIPSPFVPTSTSRGGGSSSVGSLGSGRTAVFQGEDVFQHL